ncbi:clathrin heavy chain 1-like isoform X2 [Stegodyphus dumicola]|uniref:clathrin heavy chain 1-like isoform X2 n=1 Tax=Stegodyphus dumicola TaxID=202533 RepID=UPI0015AC1436|nr:clathrin heavy chain 1-like isoform X2 [Stegodyphus dumicola]
MMLRTRDHVLKPPLRITELLQLTHLRIPLEHITWPRVTMTSDQWICIRHSIMRSNYRNGTAITVLNPHNSLPQTWQAVADCAQMNPIKPVIAVKAGSTFQVYDLRSRKCLHRCSLTYCIQFWTWIDSSALVIVSDTSVYHWYLDEQNQLPVKIFCRDLRMKNAQLVHYATDSNMKWFALSGLVAEDSHVVGITQIFSVDHNLCQNIEAHCVCFTSYQFKGNMQPSCVLVAASRGTEIHGKLHAVELGPHLTGNLAYTSHTGAIEFSDQWFRYDFPSSIQVSSKLGLVYIVTKYGTLHLCDLETCATLCCINVCTDIIFSTAFNKETEGIIAISRNGQVLSIDLKREQLVKYVWEVAKRFHIAERLSQVLKES